jgi:hypothetical protein
MKLVAILSYIALKRISYVEKLPILWSAEDFVYILWSPKFISLFYGPQAKIKTLTQKVFSLNVKIHL